MDQLHLYAYESLGVWSITASYDRAQDNGLRSRNDIYRGDHVAIDEEDPLIRAVLLLHQVTSDLEMAIRDNLDSVARESVGH